MLDHLVLNHLPARSNSTSRLRHIRCDNIDTANTVKELMQQQWSELVKPRCGVKVKKFVDAVVERTHFISELSFDCCYFL